MSLAIEVDTAQPEQPAAGTTTPALPQATEQPASPLAQPDQGQPVPASADATAPTLVPEKRRRNTPAAPKEKKISALDAAARVLAESGQPMNCQELIDAMAQSGYWSSPGGKTPHSTLYSAIMRYSREGGKQPFPEGRPRQVLP